jgi:hypothetical protein
MITEDICPAGCKELYSAIQLAILHDPEPVPNPSHYKNLFLRYIKPIR